jgi:hypothetical protein
MWIYRCIITVCTLENKLISKGDVVEVIDCDMSYSQNEEREYVVSFNYKEEEFCVPVEVFNVCFKREYNG